MGQNSELALERGNGWTKKIVMHSHSLYCSACCQKRFDFWSLAKLHPHIDPEPIKKHKQPEQ